MTGPLDFRGLADERGDPKTASVVYPGVVVGGHPYARRLADDGYEVLVLSHAGPDLGAPHRKVALADGGANEWWRYRAAVVWVAERICSGRPVAVLCRSGANRSVAVAACAFWLAGRFETPADAVRHMRRVRREASCGKNFSECVRASMSLSGLTARNYHEEYYREHQAAGLDYCVHGEWQESYGGWLVDALVWRDLHVLDLGCACGSIAEGLRRAGAKAHGVDLNNHTIGLGKKRFPGLPLYVCDAVNLHLFGPDSFDGVHCAQVAEHWKPPLVPFILEEVFPGAEAGRPVLPVPRHGRAVRPPGPHPRRPRRRPDAPVPPSVRLVGGPPGGGRVRGRVERVGRRAQVPPRQLLRPPRLGLVPGRQTPHPGDR
jgi:hypothetical protein